MDDTRCPDNGTYVKAAGTVIFVLAWPFVVFDIKYYPVGRPGAALIGATFMVLFGITSQDDVYNNILGTMANLQTLFLLIGMMLLSYYFDREGMLPFLASKIFGKSSKNRSFFFILWQVCLLSGVLSAFITNDATAVVLTPIFVDAHIKQGRAKVEVLPLLLAIATSCNIGSAATIFGNPQNAFIASSAGVSLLDALITILPSAAVGLLLNTGLLYGFYILNVCWHKYRERNQTSSDDEPMEQNTNIDTVEPRNMIYNFTPLQQARRSLYLFASVPNLTNENDEHQNNEGRGRIELNDVLSASEPTIHYNLHMAVSESGTTRTSGLTTKARMKKVLFITWLIFITILVIVLLAIPNCPGGKSIKFNLGLVPVAAGILTMLIDAALNGNNASLAITDIDWSLIALFMGLFVWLSGFEQTGFPCELVKVLEEHLLLTTFKGVMLFTVLVSVGSNVFSNVPLVILIVDQLDTLCGANFVNCHLLGGTVLAWVSTIAGNLTLFGSICNIIVAEKSKMCVIKAKITNKHDYQLSFLGYLAFGVISTIVVMFSCLPIVYFTATAIRETSLASSSDACVNATDF